MQRRAFIKTSSAALLGTGATIHPPEESRILEKYCPTPSLNAFSFNDALQEGSMSLDQLFRFAAETGFRSVDLTAYFIPGYPEAPSDELLFLIKQKAFRWGISFSGTGVKNDFTVEKEDELDAEIEHVKDWIVAASKLGAPVIRIFDGKGDQSGKPAHFIRKQVIDAFRECTRFARRFGVMVAFQNKDGIFRTNQDLIRVVQKVNSEWFGLKLDTYHVEGPDPYASIASLIPHAVSWQLKEKVRVGDRDKAIDIPRLMSLMHKGSYYGFLPMETLGEGVPEEKVQAFYQKVSKYSCSI
jgi:sugar phosphate isomerase/epimerase